SDADGDILLFTVQFSTDDGAHWEMLRVNETDLGVAVSTRYLSGGVLCRLRVMATDGFNTTVAVTPAFALPTHAPVVTCSGIQDQQILSYGAKAVVRALAYDAEDGSLPAASIQWSLSGPEVRSQTGTSRFTMRGLAPG